MMLVISPHLDDAVLSCGALLAAHRGAVVATVFAGVPRDPRQRTEWDARSGVADAAEDACRHAKAGTRLASKCASGHVESADSLRTELKELEERKELNLRKLRQKWPAGVMAELRC